MIDSIFIVYLVVHDEDSRGGVHAFTLDTYFRGKIKRAAIAVHFESMTDQKMRKGRTGERGKRSVIEIPGFSDNPKLPQFLTSVAPKITWQ